MQARSVLTALAAFVLLNIVVVPARAQHSEVPFEPFVDVTLWPPVDLVQLATRTGQLRFTLAFIQSDGTCNPKWAGIIGFADPTYDFEGKIAALKAVGGSAIISFGGAAGIPLAATCRSVEELKEAYRTVVDQYQVYRLDFDIEGAALAIPDEVHRRSAAVAALQQELANEGKTLEVSLTLPTLSTGLTGDDTTPFDSFGGYDVVKSARDAGVEIRLVNIMAMDYYQPHCASSHLHENSPSLTPMGQCALDAALSLHEQLLSLYPGLSESEAWTMVGVTPMIGQNDAPSEVFTLADAGYLEAFADERGIGRLSMWSVHRDTPCPGGGATFNCNGIGAPEWAFTGALGGTGSPPVLECADGIDNDGDGWIDAADEGCDNVIGNGVTEDSDNDLPPPAATEVRMEFEVTSDWGSGFNAEVTITNTGATTIDGWTLEFDSANPIGSLWNGVTSVDGNHYTIRNAAWNGRLEPGDSVAVGFGGGGAGTRVLTGCRFNGAECTFDGIPSPPTPTTCEDGIDNNGDGFIDEQDPGCDPAIGDGVEEASADAEPSAGGTLAVEFLGTTSDWGTGYCADARVVNDTGEAVDDWEVSFAVEGTVTSLWNASWNQNGAALELKALSWNRFLAQGASAAIGYCATR